ncbi:MAG TPA: hypothetical protein EYH31_09615, partial [Anaerolineae bacterium]|nr:hypothetical protein [Anaerolineae bacterium]
MRAEHVIRFQGLVTHPNRRVAALATGLLILGGALIGGAYVALLGPTLALAGAAAIVGGLLMLQSVQWGLIFLIGISTLLPFAALPFK